MGDDYEVDERVVGSVNKGECRTIVRQATIMNRGRWRAANEVKASYCADGRINRLRLFRFFSNIGVWT